MGTRMDKKSTMTALEREVVILRAQNDRLAGERWLLDDEGLTAMEDLVRTMDNNQGYWRMGRARDGNYFARWKWTEGPYAGHYVMGGHNTLPRAILSCQGEVDKVERGIRSPLLDKGYKGKKG